MLWYLQCLRPATCCGTYSASALPHAVVLTVPQPCHKLAVVLTVPQACHMLWYLQCLSPATCCGTYSASGLPHAVVLTVPQPCHKLAVVLTVSQACHMLWYLQCLSPATCLLWYLQCLQLVHQVHQDQHFLCCPLPPVLLRDLSLPSLLALPSLQEDPLFPCFLAVRGVQRLH